MHNRDRPARGAMAQGLVVIGKGNGSGLPALYAPDAKTAERIVEFFTARIRNKNTRKAYTFAAWCQEHGIGELA